MNDVEQNVAENLLVTNVASAFVDVTGIFFQKDTFLLSESL